MTMEINGVAHIRLNVDRFEECIAFYDQLMPYLGLQVVHRSDQFVYYVGGRTGYYVARVDAEHAGESNAPTGLGLDHVCFRARSREDIDELFGFLMKIDATMVREPEEGPWAPGYYSLSFLDPEGIRLEVNHVPGKGVFAKDASFDPAPDYPLTGRRPSSASGNVDFVRSIFAAWERGELRAVDWADPEIEFVFADGPDPGTWHGHAGLADAFRDWLSAFAGFRLQASEFRELDDERVLTLSFAGGHGKASGLDLRQTKEKTAHLFHIHGGRVTKLVVYFDRERAFADLGISAEAGSSDS
jgi:catechol 2,3-dioxygenase-like lactoylglutathione lyase family enzyme/ketosteroid isomerase-like protein